MEDNFGGRLSYVMSIRNMRQKELAKAANVTEATVSRYVNNKRSPDIDFIRAIVQILNVSADYLLGFSESININGINDFAQDGGEGEAAVGRTCGFLGIAAELIFQIGDLGLVATHHHPQHTHSGKAYNQNRQDNDG